MAEKLIEAVCDGNIGRSTVAELIIQNELNKRGAHEYRAISSGTSAYEIANGTVPYKDMRRVIDAAVKRDLYTDDEIRQIVDEIRFGNEKGVKKFFEKGLKVFIGNDLKYRAEALVHFGIEGTLKETPEQTIARPDTAAVFSMQEKHNKKVQKIYKGTGFTPVIDVLSRYANGEIAPNTSALGGGREEYFKVFEQIMHDVPLALDKLLR